MGSTKRSDYNSEFEFEFAHAVRKTGDLTFSRVLLRKLIHRKPDYARAHYSLGLIEKTLQNETIAKMYFQRAVRLDPKNTRFKRTLATHIKAIGHKNDL